MFKILQVRLQLMWIENFQMFNLYLEKAEEPEIKLTTYAGSQKNQGNSEKKKKKKNLLLLYWLHESLWLCGSQQTVEYS